MEMKEIVRPIYSELQGYLSQAPDSKKESAIDDSNFWEQYNNAINELNRVTGKDYSGFKLVPQNNEGYRWIVTASYRQKLGGLISRLHGEYFSDETPPFSGMPATIITQSQNQNQSLQVQLLLEVNDLIHKKLDTAPEGSNEKTFLERIKASLSSVRDVGQLVSLLITTAHQLGITIEQLKNLFS